VDHGTGGEGLETRRVDHRGTSNALHAGTGLEPGAVAVEQVTEQGHGNRGRNFRAGKLDGAT
jgi:hypothetical protein